MVRIPARIVVFILFSGLAVFSQGPRDYIHSLAGQKFLLRHFGNGDSKVKSKDLQSQKGTCDVAVLVREAEWNKNKVRLRWDLLGTPYLHVSERAPCRRTMIYDHGTLEISGYREDETAVSLETSLHAVLQTPEQYLAAEGVPFNLSPDPDLENPPPAPGQPFTHPKALLTVNAAFSEQARRARMGGTVKIDLYVGADGRVHTPAIPHKMGMGLDEAALNVLSFWRFEPARKQDQPVAYPMSVEMSFNIY
jgi:TonB family protein